MPNLKDTNREDPFLIRLPETLTLSGEFTILEPLQFSHIESLNSAAADGELWKLEVTSVPRKEQMHDYVEQAIEQRSKGRELPFVIRRSVDNQVVGITRYYDISSVNRNLSIGYTWYAQSAQRTAINTECKLLLLTYAFEVLRCISVQWHTHHQNLRSQAAILRLGAKFEGVLRNHRILPDGRIRHTHCFSMLDTEWPESKAFLSNRLAAHS